MSLILEALNRSAQERQTDSNNPGLDTPAYVDEPELNRAWLSWLPWAALLFTLVALGLLLVDKFSEEKSPPTAEVRQIQKQPTAPTPPQTEGKNTSPGLVRNAKTPELVEPQAATEQLLIAVALEAKDANPVISDPAVDALYAGESQSPPERSTPQQANKPAPVESKTEAPPQRSERTIDIEEVLAKTEEALKTARLQEHSAPFIADVSQQFKNDIPTIMYRQHDYSSKPGESFVVLNGKTVRAGGKTAGGTTVEEILSDSVVLNHRGKQFRLRALNSWVNL